MVYSKKSISLIFTLFFTVFYIFPQNLSNSPYRPHLTEESVPLLKSTELSVKLKIFKDPTGSMKCNDIPDESFIPIDNPYKPKYFEGILWFDLEINKPLNFDGQRHLINLGNEHIDFAEAFAFYDGKWNLIGRTGRNINKTEMSMVAITQMIPLMKNLFDENKDVTHIRLRLTSNTGSPVKIKIISNIKFYQSTSRIISRLCFTGGIAICIFFGLLLTGLLLKDHAYLFLAFSALCYIIKAMQARGTGPVLIWNFINYIPNSNKIEYIVDGLQVLFLAISAGFFFSIKNTRPIITKTTPIIFETVLIEIIIITTISSPMKMFIAYIVISIIQKILLLCGIFRNIRSSDIEKKVIFIPWIAVFIASIILRIILLLNNFTSMALPENIIINEIISSTLGFLLLTVPALYTLGKRFNVRYQFVQREYQELEEQFIEHQKIKRLVDTVTTPLRRLSVSILNSAGILSRLNFSATNAEYIELIKKESSKMNDLLTAIRILTKDEPGKKEPVQLLSFTNSCMQTIKTFAKDNQCTPSLTTAIASDTIILADIRILEFIFTSIPFAVFHISNPGARFSVYTEEKEGSFTLTITCRLKSGLPSTEQGLLQCLNDETYFNFILETSKTYDGVFEITPLDEDCRFTFTCRFEKATGTDRINVVIDKTTFEISENSSRLLKSKTKENQPSHKTQLNNTEDASPSLSNDLNHKNNGSGNEEIKDVFEKYDFSTREKEIATLIIEGKSDKEIASQLNISPQTVATHNKKIFKKADVHSRVELINKVR